MDRIILIAQTLKLMLTIGAFAFVSACCGGKWKGIFSPPSTHHHCMFCCRQLSTVFIPFFSDVRTNSCSMNEKCEAALLPALFFFFFLSCLSLWWGLHMLQDSCSSALWGLRCPFRSFRVHSCLSHFVHPLCVPRLFTATKAGAAALNGNLPLVQGRHGCNTTGLFAVWQ